jgi:hypothetical protein
MNNITRHPQCHMRTSLGNCDPIGGFCTSINESVCEGLHKVSRPQGEWIIEIDTNGYTYGRCSICGMRQYVGQINFCPDCGARMKGESDE